MSSYSAHRATIVVSNSPVSFAIMGPSEPHRHVLIRSNDLNLDLVGMDNRSLLSDIEETREGLFSVGWLLVPELRSFIVRTAHDYRQPISDGDPRSSHLSFAWRGLASQQDLAQIEKTFWSMAADLAVALDEEASGSAEWQVAPLVALCRSKTDAQIRLRKHRRAAVIFSLAVYGLITLFFAANLPYLIERMSR